MKLFGSRILLSLALLTLAGCGEPGKPTTVAQADEDAKDHAAISEVAQLILSNPSDFARRDEAVYLSYYELGLASDYGSPLAVWQRDTEIPVQTVDKDGDGSKDGILFVVDMAVDEEVELRIAKATNQYAQSGKRTQAEISHKTGGSWSERKYEGGRFQNVSSLDVPEEHTDHSYFIRYEGPGIESDLVGYRVYLDWRNGFDIFGKRTPVPVLQDVGQDGFDSYHEMADWGMDILKVGSSLGIGGYGYWDGEQAVRVSDVQDWSATVPENGDLYSAFSIHYADWEPESDKQTDLRALLSMHAGSRLVEVTATTAHEIGPMVTGLVKHPDTELLVGNLDIGGNEWTYLGTYGEQSLDGSKLGMGILVKRKAIKKIAEDDHNHLLVLDPAANEINYYFTAAWEKEAETAHGPITSIEQFRIYLEQEAEKLTMPLRRRLTTTVSQALTQQPLTGEAALQWSRKVADSELQRKTLDYAFGGFDPIRKRPSYFEYTTGLLMQGYDDLNRVAPDPRYADAIEAVMGSFVNSDGSINGYVLSKYNIDSINAGKMLLRMYERNGKASFKAAVQTLNEQLDDHPRTSAGAFWHKKRYPSQVWLDGVYMGMPFLAHYEKLMHAEPDFSEVLAEFRVVHEKLRDPETGLYYHAWDESREQVWADEETGLSAYHWSRGMGWLAMALVDVLEFIPEDKEEERQYLLGMIEELAPVLQAYQDDATGTWYQIIDMPEARGNYLESTASSMFTYFFAKGVNAGYLPESYVTTAKTAYQGLLDEFVQVHADGTVSITNMCQVAGLGYGRDGSYRYYMSEPVFTDDPKGTGPFIMAGVEMHKLLNTYN